MDKTGLIDSLLTAVGNMRPSERYDWNQLENVIRHTVTKYTSKPAEESQDDGDLTNALQTTFRNLHNIPWHRSLSKREITLLDSFRDGWLAYADHVAARQSEEAQDGQDALTAFERWAEDKLDISAGIKGVYLCESTDLCWQAWQEAARAADRPYGYPSECEQAYNNGYADGQKEARPMPDLTGEMVQALKGIYIDTGNETARLMLDRIEQAVNK